MNYYWKQPNKINCIIEGNCRYLLECEGTNPIICIGINPSIACREISDKTMNNIENIAANNNYDGWKMINLYPEISKDLHKLPSIKNIEYFTKNIQYIKDMLKEQKEINVLVAFGNAIYNAKMEYLKECFKEILKLFEDKNVNWFCIERNKSFAPKHPSRASTTRTLEEYNIDVLREKLGA